MAGRRETMNKVMKMMLAAGAVMLAGVMSAESSLIAQFSGNMITNSNGTVNNWVNSASGGLNATGVSGSTTTVPYAGSAVINGQTFNVLDYGANTGANTALWVARQSALDNRPVSVAMVFKHAVNASAAQNLFMIDDEQHAASFQVFINSSNNRITVGGRNSADGAIQASSTTALTDGTWYVAFGTLSTDDTVKIRVVELLDQNDDSMLFGSASGANKGLSGNKNVYIGNSGGNRTTAFKGLMAEMRIYDSDLDLANTTDGVWMTELDSLRASIPEPATLGLFIISSGGVLLMRRLWS